MWMYPTIAFFAVLTLASARRHSGTDVHPRRLEPDQVFRFALDTGRSSVNGTLDRRSYSGRGSYYEAVSLIQPPCRKRLRALTPPGSQGLGACGITSTDKDYM